MNKEFILVIDSGLGGITILKSLKKRLLNNNFIYILDNKNSPYGNKRKTELIKNIIKLIDEYISKYKIKLVVLACNTITSVAINEIRKFIERKRLKILNKIIKKKYENLLQLNNLIKLEKKLYNIKIVGTEPPVKQVNSNKKTLVLATKQTLRYNKTLKKYKDNKNFTFIPLKNVAKMLDENFFNRKQILETLKKQIKYDNYKNVVLGCTHYYYLKKEIKQILKNKNLKFYVATKGVTKRVNFLLQNEDEKKETTKKQTIKIFLTKNDFNLKKITKFLLKQK